jgi:hypothetical protein
MLGYFQLQGRMVHRWIKDAGIAPWLAYGIIAVMFGVFSEYLFANTGFAPYVYAGVALAMTGKLSETRRTDFLTLCFGNAKRNRLRIAENLSVAIPFIGFMLYRQLPFAALGLALLTSLMALANFSTTINFTIPTPFSAKPFEFAVGFRNTFYLIIAAYGLTIAAMVVGNFNLGGFALLLMFVVVLTYYVPPEAEYYVWNHSLSPKAFLFHKMKIALVYVSFLVVPIVISLGICFPDYGLMLVGLTSVGYGFLLIMLVGKYAAYPYEMNVPQGVLIALCVWFPPLLLVLIPYLFRKSKQRLNAYLK